MRDEILDLAERQLKEGGYEKLSFAEIAKSLKITRANIHYHFKNKETLALRASERFVIDREADISKLAAANSDDFIKFTLAVETYFLKTVECCGFSSCLCSQIIRNPDSPDSLYQLAQEHLIKLRTVGTEVAKASIKAGKLKPSIKPDIIARELSLLIGGMNIMGMLLKKHPELAEAQMSGVLSEWIKKYK